MVSTPLKNISQNGNLPQVGVKIKNIRNHHLAIDFESQDNLQLFKKMGENILDLGNSNRPIIDIESIHSGGILEKNHHQFSIRGKPSHLFKVTLPKFNSSPLKSYQNPIGKDRLPTTIFQGLCQTSRV